MTEFMTTRAVGPFGRPIRALTSDQEAHLESCRQQAIAIQSRIDKQIAVWEKQRKVWNKRYDTSKLFPAEDYGKASGVFRAQLIDAGQWEGDKIDA